MIAIFMRHRIAGDVLFALDLYAFAALEPRLLPQIERLAACISAKRPATPPQYTPGAP
eukprot:m.51073 g.51073  ORF g.51073 m.51073 type:complete len:58 (+) comp48223_c0_seq2:1866-2039(+)